MDRTQHPKIWGRWDGWQEVLSCLLWARIGPGDYPNLFEIVPGDPDAALKTAVNAATAELNLTIQQAVAAAEASDINIVYVAVNAAFVGHRTGSPDPYINGPDAFHPNAAGYQAFAAAIQLCCQPKWLDEHKQSA